MSDLLKDIVLLAVNVLWYALLAQIILSWLVVAGVRNDTVARLYNALGTILEPLMAPLRRVVPRVGLFDITPLVAFFVLFIVRRVIERVL